MRFRAAIFLATVVATPVMAQDHAGGFADLKPLQTQFMNWIVAAAEQVPEAKYSYRPTAAVRTFGELLGHVANANFAICAAAKSEESPGKEDLEKAGRAAIIAGLKQAIAYCDSAFALPHGKQHEKVSVFGMNGTRLWAVGLNISHNAEHYGNIVTYMRMIDMTPPSSQGN